MANFDQINRVVGQACPYCSTKEKDDDWPAIVFVSIRPAPNASHAERRVDPDTGQKLTVWIEDRFKATITCQSCRKEWFSLGFTPDDALQKAYQHWVEAWIWKTRQVAATSNRFMEAMKEARALIGDDWGAAFTRLEQKET